MKKSNEKMLVSVIAGLTALQGVSATLLNVSAKDYEVTGVTVHHSQKDRLESNLYDSKNRMDESNVRADVAQNEVVQIKNRLDQVQTNYDHQQDVTNQVYQSAYASLLVQLQPLLDEIDGLETQIKEAKTDLDSKISASQKAASDLDKAQTTLDEKKDTLKKLQDKLDTYKDLKEAAGSKAAAEASVNEAQKKVDAASRELEEVSKYVNSQQISLDQATKDYNAALADASNKQAILNEKQALVDSFDDESTRVELEQAKVDLEASNEALNQATSIYNSALASYQKIQEEYDVACTNLKNANTSLSQTKDLLEQVQKDSVQSQTKLEEKNKEVVSLKKQVENAQFDVDSAQLEYDSALKDYNSVLSPLEKAKKNLDEFETEHKTQLNQLSLGIQGYYDSLGATAASDIIKDPRGKLAGYTHIGAENDATSIDNVMNSISYLKEFNKIRESEGLPELKVSMSLMAISQANANWQRDEAKIGDVAHAGVYQTGENAAWGYGDAGSKASPFTAWYNMEKAWYSNGVTDWHKIGHYKNIVNQSYVYTGYAHMEEGAYGSTDIQEFDYTYGQEGVAGEKDCVMSVDEFEKSLYQYVSGLSDVDTKHKSLLEDVKNAKDTKDDRLLNQTLSVLNSRKDALSNLQAQLLQSNKDREIFRQDVNNKETSVSQLRDSVKNLSQIVKQKESVKSDTEVELKHSKLNVETSGKNHLKTQSDRDALQTKIQSLIDQLDNWNVRKQEAMDAKADYEKAQSLESSTKERLNYTRDVYTKAVYKKSLVQQDMDTNMHVLNETQTILNEKITYYNAVKQANDAYAGAAHDLEVVTTQMDILRKDKKELESKIQKLTNHITTLNESLDKNESAALPYQDVMNILNDVFQNGSRADLLNLEGVALKNEILELANNVDCLHTIQDELGQVKQDYVNAYNAYLDVKTEKLSAQNEYNKAMDALNTYLSTQTNAVNTGVDTGVMDSMLMSCLAGLGVVTALHQKRKEED